jgi:excinuclease ABC subunit A
LKPIPLAVTIGGLNIWDVTELTVEKILEYLDGVKLTGARLEIARQIIKEIRDRTEFLFNVGLDYITLSRPANTLSGGESQRIRLATQIGSRLTGVLYILDEPTIGLHQRDNKRLVGTLKGLRDLGNTVIVVEHDEGTIRSSDHVIDLGPGAGVDGGEVIAEGPVEKVTSNPKSVTGRFLNLDKRKKLKKEPRNGNGKHLKVLKPRHNNLKGMNVGSPLGSS